ncbi:MAG: AbrB/MazE/SpoVT family DNA-binding domain-containing protein [Opitutales bacterium]
MKTTIDHAGRLVIPKELRNQFHLTGGTEVEILPDGDSLRLRQPQKTSVFTEKDGVLVQTSEARLDIDTTSFINQQRDARAFGTTPPGESS